MRRLLILLLVCSCVACAGAAPIRAQNDDVAVVLAIDERTLGFRSGTLLITERSGAPIEDATVTVTAVMKQHGMINPPLQLSHSDAGYQFDRLEVNMVGEWQLQIRITRSTLRTTVDIPIVFE